MDKIVLTVRTRWRRQRCAAGRAGRLTCQIGADKYLRRGAARQTTFSHFLYFQPLPVDFESPSSGCELGRPMDWIFFRKFLIGSILTAAGSLQSLCRTYTGPAMPYSECSHSSAHTQSRHNLLPCTLPSASWAGLQ